MSVIQTKKHTTMFHIHILHVKRWQKISIQKHNLIIKNNHMSPFHLDPRSFSIVTLVHIFSQVLTASSKRKWVSIGMKHLALHPYHLKKNPYIFQSSSFNYEWTPNNRHYQNVWNRASVPSKKMHRHPT